MMVAISSEIADSRPLLHVITPVTPADLAVDAASLPKDPGWRIACVQITDGPESIESAYESAQAVPDVLRLIGEANQAGAAACVLDCMGDPGLRAGRELGPTLVMGPAMAGFHAACMLGDRYSVLAVSRNLESEHRALARDYGLEARLASVRAVEIPILQLNDDVDHLVDALVVQARLAVVEDGADVLVLGCTGMIGVVDRVAEGLEAQGITGVPVIDPFLVGIEIAKALAGLGLTRKHPDLPPPQPGISGVTTSSPRPRMLREERR